MGLVLACSHVRVKLPEQKGGRETRKEGGEEVNRKLLDTDWNPKFWVIQQNVASLFLVFYRLEELL